MRYYCWLLLAFGCTGHEAADVEDCGAEAGCVDETPLLQRPSCVPRPGPCDGAACDDAEVDDTGDTGSSDTGAAGDPCVETGATLPADVLNLTDWKLTLPIAATEDTSTPMEIEQPELSTYHIAPYFGLDATADRVRFLANAGGVTTSGSHYPRSELREMIDGGAAKASWTTTSGVHTMTITQAITHLPEAKPEVVAGQIHDAEDDVVMIRLEGSHLFVEGGGDDLGTLTSNYVLGDEFTVRFVAANGVIEVFYEDLSIPLVHVEREASGCYFKAGVYTQSNEDRGDMPEAYGEVEIRDLVVTHE